MKSGQIGAVFSIPVTLVNVNFRLRVQLPVVQVQE